MSIKAEFVVHPVKSVLDPMQEIVYLGFCLNSEKMTVKTNRAKSEEIKNCL